ncbi:hypothetical protein SAMN05443245_5264 [Paraburkholderia fungorum]|uniref:Outer membrane protein beta-barrel domain-containing protein n=1 Tax=Paraburkholderia fungorum TaxID=134537 RepID=A0A1H1IJD9_9BURK|nr:hypothetical protein [Paraburkholderia fungorum]SDR37773.1 hypothetical protein SAMN05443245_5264 [Paraburkholderia fungorum]
MSLGCAAASAHAEQSWFGFEAGLGVTSATPVGDGVYFSKGFSHSTPNGSYGGRAGIVLNAIEAPPRSWKPGLRFHLTYSNFGKVKWSSMNPQDAADFSNVGQQGGYSVVTQSCVDNNCGDFRKFDSTGGMQAISLTFEPYWDLGSGWQIGVEAGPALYKSTWTAIATAQSDGIFGPAGTQETLTHPPRIQLGALFGASIAKGPFSVRANYLYAPIGAWQGKNVPAGIKGEFMLSANYTF